MGFPEQQEPGDRFPGLKCRQDCCVALSSIPEAKPGKPGLKRRRWEATYSHRLSEILLTGTVREKYCKP